MPEAVTLEFLAARVAALTDDMHDIKLRMSALENRFASLEARFGALEARVGGIERRLDLIEERSSRMLAILVRLAERQGVATDHG